MEQDETDRSHVDYAALSTLQICAGDRVWAVRLEESSTEDSNRPKQLSRRISACSTNLGQKHSRYRPSLVISNG